MLSDCKTIICGAFLHPLAKIVMPVLTTAEKAAQQDNLLHKVSEDVRVKTYWDIVFTHIHQQLVAMMDNYDYSAATTCLLTETAHLGAVARTSVIQHRIQWLATKHAEHGGNNPNDSDLNSSTDSKLRELANTSTDSVFQSFVETVYKLVFNKLAGDPARLWAYSAINETYGYSDAHILDCLNAVIAIAVREAIHHFADVAELANRPDRLNPVHLIAPTIDRTGMERKDQAQPSSVPSIPLTQHQAMVSRLQTDFTEYIERNQKVTTEMMQALSALQQSLTETRASFEQRLMPLVQRVEHIEQVTQLKLAELNETVRAFHQRMDKHQASHRKAVELELERVEAKLSDDTSRLDSVLDRKLSMVEDRLARRLVLNQQTTTKYLNEWCHAVGEDLQDMSSEIHSLRAETENVASSSLSSVSLPILDGHNLQKLPSDMPPNCMSASASSIATSSVELSTSPKGLSPALVSTPHHGSSTPSFKSPLSTLMVLNDQETRGTCSIEHAEAEAVQ